MGALSTILSATSNHSWRGALLVPNTKSIKLSKGGLIWICLYSVMHLLFIIRLDLFYDYWTYVF
jgi:hypothetical protein